MPHSTRPNSEKYEKILEALRTLLETKKISQISVSEIAQTAGIGKGSIYYYFSSKEAIFDALMAKSYEEPLATAKELAKRTDISPFVRMAMIFQACRNSSAAFLKIQSDAGNGVQENAFLHNKYIVAFCWANTGIAANNAKPISAFFMIKNKIINYTIFAFSFFVWSNLHILHQPDSGQNCIFRGTKSSKVEKKRIFAYICIQKSPID